MMEREPIQKQPDCTEMNVVRVVKTTVIDDLLPREEYHIEGAPVDLNMSSEYQGYLEQFLRENQEIAFRSSDTSDTYIEGFRKAIALVNLWIESLYMPTSSPTDQNTD